MSHRERIPWSSAHPLDVKRGTFSSEISRLATLCSDKSVYLTQCDEAVNLYIGRGYPKAVVRNWLDRQLEKRWEDRVSDKPEEASGDTFFTLKTHFNEAWESFNVGELQSKITSEWKTYLNRTSSSLGKRRRQTNGLGHPDQRPARRVRVGIQGNNIPGQSRLGFFSEDGAHPVLAVGLGTNSRSRDHLVEMEYQKVSKWTREWINSAKFLVSRRKNTQLWDITRTWNKVVWDAFIERTGARRPFAPSFEGPVILNEEDE